MRLIKGQASNSDVRQGALYPSFRTEKYVHALGILFLSVDQSLDQSLGKPLDQSDNQPIQNALHFRQDVKFLL